MVISGIVQVLGQMVDRFVAWSISKCFKVKVDSYMTFFCTTFFLLIKIVIVKIRQLFNPQTENQFETKQLKDMTPLELKTVMQTYNLGFQPDPNLSIQNLELSFHSACSQLESLLLEKENEERKKEQTKKKKETKNKKKGKEQTNKETKIDIEDKRTDEERNKEERKEKEKASKNETKQQKKARERRLEEDKIEIETKAQIH